MTSYFYDSYAIIEYINKNGNYKPHFEKAKGVTTILNLMEVYYRMLKDHGAEKAEIVYSYISQIVIRFGEDTIKEAMKFRVENKDFSYADCIGYILAKKNGVKFLTGDNQFKDLPNVEFVK